MGYVYTIYEILKHYQCGLYTGNIFRNFTLVVRRIKKFCFFKLLIFQTVIYCVFCQATALVV
jgi:hypothetical protein